MKTMNIQKIMQILPHRYPFLMVDKVIDFDSGKTLTAVKNISVNEPIFTGHFPKAPVFPGVLIMEAFAQTTGLLAYTISNDILKDDKLYFFAGIDNARFKQPVVPGDQLILKVALITQKRTLWKFSAEAFVEDKLVASATIMCAEGSI